LEASTLQAPAVAPRSGVSIGISLARLRSDEQLVALFRAGHDEAFRAIHDRYRQRLFAYTRQMLPGRQDAEDALQDVFVRAYCGLRASDRHVALRAWLYRVAHNRCVDELRRPLVPPAEVFELISVPEQDPVAQADQRESLRRLIADVRRLPGQQRSALLMRELSGMSYVELAEALETTVPAVKSLLVRARMALALSLEARDAACADIRDELVLAQDRRGRPNAMARRHMRDCAGCREFRHELRGVSRQLAALAPAIGPIGVAAKLLGFGFSGSAGGGAAMGSGSAAAGGATVAGTTGTVASAGALATGASHVATLIVATVVTAGGAVEIQHTIAPAPPHHHARHAQAHHGTSAARSVLPAGYVVAAQQAVASDSVAVPAAPVLHSALSDPPPLVPVAAAKPAASSRTAKPVRAPKAAVTEASTSSSTTGDGTPGSTSSTAPGAPVITSTSVTGDSTSGTSSGSSTSTAGTSGSASESSATAAGPTSDQASAASTGSSSAGAGGGTTSGSSTGQSGSTPTGQ
jgi:RNA polymerase sigma factor (sigma-70 family)